MEVEILEKSENKAKFILNGVSAQFANALRRIMIAEVPVMAIDDVVIVENNSAMTDEVLAHRLGLIPIRTDLKTYVLPEDCGCKSELGCNKCSVTLTLDVDASDNSQVVYSDEMSSANPDVTPLSRIPIVKLVKGQGIRLEAYARLGRGKAHAKWQPVSVCAYKFLPQVKINLGKCDSCRKCVEVCPKHILQIKDNKLEVTDIMKCTLCKECVRACPKNSVDVSWDETKFIFNVETTGALPVEQVVEEAAKILEEKTKIFVQEVSKLR